MALATTLVHGGLVVRPLVTRKLSVTATASSTANPATGSQRTALLTPDELTPAAAGPGLGRTRATIAVYSSSAGLI